MSPQMKTKTQLAENLDKQVDQIANRLPPMPQLPPSQLDPPDPDPEDSTESPETPSRSSRKGKGKKATKEETSTPNSAPAAPHEQPPLKELEETLKREVNISAFQDYIDGRNMSREARMRAMNPPTPGMPLTYMSTNALAMGQAPPPPQTPVAVPVIMGQDGKPDTTQQTMIAAMMANPSLASLAIMSMLMGLGGGLGGSKESQTDSLVKLAQVLSTLKGTGEGGGFKDMLDGVLGMARFMSEASKPAPAGTSGNDALMQAFTSYVIESQKTQASLMQQNAQVQMEVAKSQTQQLMDKIKDLEGRSADPLGPIRQIGEFFGEMQKIPGFNVMGPTPPSPEALKFQLEIEDMKNKRQERLDLAALDLQKSQGMQKTVSDALGKLSEVVGGTFAQNISEGAKSALEIAAQRQFGGALPAGQGPIVPVPPVNWAAPPPAPPAPMPMQMYTPTPTVPAIPLPDTPAPPPPPPAPAPMPVFPIFNPPPAVAPVEAAVANGAETPTKFFRVVH